MGKGTISLSAEDLMDKMGISSKLSPHEVKCIIYPDEIELSAVNASLKRNFDDNTNIVNPGDINLSPEYRKNNLVPQPSTVRPFDITKIQKHSR